MANIKINISDNDLETLKKNKYKLCLAFREKSIGFDLVCIGTDQYFASNTFKVEDEYAVFFCNSLENGEVIDASSDVKNIELGQRITVNEFGFFGSPVKGQYSDRLEIVNDYGSIYPGFGRKVKYGTDDSMRYALVSSYASVKGIFTMEPENKIRIWFQQFAKPGTYFTDFISEKRMSGKSTYVDVFIDASTESDTVVLTYENGKWQKNN